MLLLVIASGAIGINMHKAIQKKKFQSELDQLKALLITSQKLALAMQADWQGTLRKEAQGWVFESVCEEISGKKLTPLHLGETEIFFNGKKIRKLEVDFFSSGLTLPEGVFVFLRNSQKVEWRTADLFSFQASS